MNQCKCGSRANGSDGDLCDVCYWRKRAECLAATDATGRQYVLVRLKRPEGYDDVHPELVLADANINPAFEPELAIAAKRRADTSLQFTR